MLARRFALQVLLPLVALVVAAEIWIYSATATHVRKQEDDHLRSVVETLDAAIDERIASIERSLAVMTSFPELDLHLRMTDFELADDASKQMQELEERYVAVASLSPGLETISLYDERGESRIHVRDGERDYKVADVWERPWFQRALAAREGQAVVSALHRDLPEQQPALTVARAILFRGKVRGVLAIDVLASSFAEDLLRGTGAAMGGHAYLLNTLGEVVADSSSDDFEPLPEVVADDLLQRFVASGDRGLLDGHTAQGEALRLAVRTQHDTKLRILLAVPQDRAFAPVTSMRDTWLLVTLAGSLLMGLLGFGLVRRIVRPVREITHGAAAVGAGNYDLTLEIPSGDELGDLARNFNQMTAALREARAAVEQKTGELQARAEEIEAAYTRVQETQQQLVHAEKMGLLGQLAGGIAHDFNNLLGGILGCADLLQRKLGTPEDHARYVDIILETARRAADLVQQLLAFARPGKTEHTEVDVHALIGEVVRILRHTVDPRITIEAHFGAEEAVVSGDASELQSALLNLGVNARDAMEGREGSLTYSTARVDLDETSSQQLAHPVKPGTYLEVGVSDTGVGMSAEVQEHIFEPFYSTKGVGKGTGLGLAAVYGTITGHDGSLSVYSDEGRGTQFKLYVPLLVSGTSAGTRRRGGMVHGEGTILLVDDEPVIRNLGREMLRMLGYEVLLASGGEQALATWDERGHEIDLVILDLVMPGMDGAAVMRELKKRSPDVRVIISSGFQADLDLSDTRESGAVAFLPKPFIATTLSRAVADALSNGQVESAATAEAPPTEAATPPPGVTPEGRRLSILCADDSAMNREVLQALLGQLGHETVVVESGEAALEAVRSRRFDMVLMDFEMPGMGGLAATRAILQEPSGRGLPVLGMSGRSSSSRRRGGASWQEVGMVGFLEKPLGLDELQAGVAQVFALPRGVAQRAADEGLAAQLAEVFCEEAPTLLAELHTALQRSDAAGVHRVAHTLYGSLRHFDADDASTLADQLQQLGADAEIDGETVRLAESLRVSCERLLASLTGSPGAPGVHSSRRRSE